MTLYQMKSKKIGKSGLYFEYTKQILHSSQLHFLLEHTKLRNDAEYQLHGFSDTLDSAFSSTIYLRDVSAGKAQVSFVIGKSKLVLTHQKGCVISRKELEEAKM